jgi:alpha-amylase/alpha-mannosidase (GH57 family)
MDANHEHYIGCHNGVFLLPENAYRTLADLVTNGFVYLRQDEEVLTISTSRIVGGHRRQLNSRYRVSMFREARKLAIVNYNDSLRVMVVS